MLKEHLEKICRAVDKRKAEITAFGEELYRCPETGFREFESAKLVMGKLKDMGLEFQTAKDIPGIKVTLDTGREGPGVALIGELDAIICNGHPDCNTETGAVHACGHNIQTASVIGAALAILDSGVLDRMNGKLHLMLVPAEEYIEVAYRKELRKQGVIRYLGGKPELMSRGFFDDVDMCAMVHVYPVNSKIALETSGNGCVVKNVKYTGKAAHAGLKPSEGINALYAANLGMMAVNSIRETFQEKDYVRVHPIITKGGEIVNVIPADVRIETFVRGKSIEAILDASKKVDRAFGGGAYAMGAEVEIEDIPGYLPLTVDKGLSSIAGTLVRELTGEEAPVIPHGAGSTDLGDICTIMPAIELCMGGITGGLHSIDFRNADHDVTYILGSKILALLAAELLCDDARLARSVRAEYKPIFNTKQQYYDFVDGIFSKKVLP